jgi:hypothetical protein
MEIKLYDRKQTLLVVYGEDSEEGNCLFVAAVGDRVQLPSGQRPNIYERVFDPKTNSLSIYLRSTVDLEAEGFTPADTQPVVAATPKRTAAPAKKAAR